MQQQSQKNDVQINQRSTSNHAQELIKSCLTLRTVMLQKGSLLFCKRKGTCAFFFFFFSLFSYMLQLLEVEKKKCPLHQNFSYTLQLHSPIQLHFTHEVLIILLRAYHGWKVRKRSGESSSPQHQKSPCCQKVTENKHFFTTSWDKAFEDLKIKCRKGESLVSNASIKYQEDI